MERSDLDLQFSVCEGDTASISQLVLFGHLRADVGNPHRPAPELLILCRDDSGCPPPWITKSAVADQDVARLVRLLDAAGFPKRVPRIVPNRALLCGGQHLALVIRLDGRQRSLNLVLQHAGFSGDDAEPVRSVLHHLGDLAEAAGRPTVRAVMDHLVRDRRPRVGPEWPHGGLTPRRDDPVSRFAVGAPAGLGPEADLLDDPERPAPLRPGVESRLRPWLTWLPVIGRGPSPGSQPDCCDPGLG
jgi:hypothetical protein